MKDSDLYQTPDRILTLVREVFDGEIGLDPCGYPGREIANLTYFEGFKDGLREPWYSRTFVNPPFSECALWLEKARREHDEKGVSIITITLASMNAKYVHDLGLNNGWSAVCFPRKRINFLRDLQPTKSVRHETMIGLFGTPAMARNFKAVFSVLGKCVTL